MFLNLSLSATKPNLPPCCHWGEGPRTAAESKQRNSKAQVFTDTLRCGRSSLPSAGKMDEDGLWSQQCFLQKLRVSCRVLEDLLCPPLPSGAGWLMEALSRLPVFFPTVVLCRSLRVCLDDSALLCSAAYTCSLSVNNCINFIGSPSLNWLRFMQQTGLVPGPPEQRLLVRGGAQAARRMGGLSKRTWSLLVPTD